MSQDVLLTVINSMSWNNDSVNVEMQTCDSCEKCLNLDAELSKSKQAYNDLLKNYSQLEKHCISLEVSMQLKQEVFQNDDSCVNQNAVEIKEYFEINDLKARLQDKDKTICKLKATIKSLRENTKEENVNPDKCDLEPINKELENSVAKLLSENEPQIQDKVFVITSLKNDLRKSKGKEIVENVVHIPSATTFAPKMFKLDLEPLPPRLLQNREVHITYLRNTQEQANILQEIVEQAKVKQPLDSKLDLACKYATRIQVLLVYVQDMCPNAIKPSTKKVVVTPINNVKKVRSEVVQIVLWYLDSGCSKYMTGNRSQLMNFVSKFLGTVRFENDQIARIMSYGDYQLGNVIISRVYYVEGLGHNLFSIGQFCDADLELAKDSLARGIPRLKFHKDHLCSACALGKIQNVRTDNGTEFVNQTLREWAEAINTACYTQNYSLICLRYNKTPYELMQDKKLDLSFFHVFGSLCYPTNDHEDLCKFDAKADIGIFVGYAPAKKGFRIYNRRTLIITETIHVTFDELTAMASEQSSSRLGLYYMTPATSSTGLGSNPVSQQPCLPPKRDDWDHFFQPMFDEYFNPPPIAISPVQEAAALRSKVLADSHVSTSIDQDAPSTSIPSSQEHVKSLIISQGSSSNVRLIHTPFEHLGRWTKDHPIANMISDPSRSVSTRKQLETDAMWCYFDSFLTSVEPKNFKQAMTEPSWIDAMQEEIHEFERLEDWELV
ncbi:retrovirus-related pol polyprotein from transposon TNT 1-94, partial [Tanacetum coccineum]